ncbi:hypothetical protein CSPX01_06891 [Colletotrichum filicis]|nr:hypothetical protein CSPX01_06891 [Colletotrichum filicis]
MMVIDARTRLTTYLVPRGFEASVDAAGCTTKRPFALLGVVLDPARDHTTTLHNACAEARITLAYLAKAWLFTAMVLRTTINSFTNS